MAKSSLSPRNSPAAPKKKKRARWLVFAMLPILICGGWWAGTTIYHRLTFQPTGQIAFVCQGDTKDANGYFIMQICIVNADGTGRRQITNDEIGANSPAWSPDGAQIAYVAKVYNPAISDYVSMLFIMNADGTGARQITDSRLGYYYYPAWSPDGKQIAFLKYYKDNGRSSIGIISVSGLEETRLSSLPAVADSPVWSPDGRQIAFSTFAQDAYGEARLYVMNADGSSPTQLTEISSLSPTWSPDGKQIAFACASPRAEICTVKSDGSGQTILSNSFVFGVNDPSWSPDGQYIAYRRRTCPICSNENGQIWLMKADGSQQTRLTDGPADLDPAWRPQP